MQLITTKYGNCIIYAGNAECWTVVITIKWAGYMAQFVVGKELDKDDPKQFVRKKGRVPLLVTTPISVRNCIIAISGSTDIESLQVSRNYGPSTNDIFVDKIDGEGSGLAVYCFCWNSMLGIGIT